MMPWRCQPASFPEPAATLVPNGPELLTALDAAVQTTARDAARYALTRVQLRSGSGEVLATDGKLLLIQAGRLPRGSANIRLDGAG